METIYSSPTPPPPSLRKVASIHCIGSISGRDRLSIWEAISTHNDVFNAYTIDRDDHVIKKCSAHRLIIPIDPTIRVGVISVI